MIVETRKTAQGTEYWDAKEKRVRFVPAGEDPDFEVTENPKSMVPAKEGKSKEAEKETDINKMTIPQLKEHAADNGIEIPSDITKKDDIKDFIVKAEAPQNDDGTNDDVGNPPADE